MNNKVRAMLKGMKRSERDRIIDCLIIGKHRGNSRSIGIFWWLCIERELRAVHCRFLSLHAWRDQTFASTIWPNVLKECNCLFAII